MFCRWHILKRPERGFQIFGHVSDRSSDLFSHFSICFSCQIKHFSGAASFCRRAALKNVVRRNCVHNRWLSLWLSALPSQLRLSSPIGFGGLLGNRYWISVSGSYHRYADDCSDPVCRHHFQFLHESRFFQLHDIQKPGNHPNFRKNALGVKRPFSELSESSGVFSEQLSEFEIPFSEYEIPFSEWHPTTWAIRNPRFSEQLPERFPELMGTHTKYFH